MVHIEQKDQYILLTISRPEALNALNREVFDGLKDFFSEGHKAYDTYAAVIVTGAGRKAFAAGADIKEFTELDPAGMEALSKRGQEIFGLIENFHKPVLAAVNGFALGGGCELAMACHLRIASESARFGQPEVNLGIIPGYGATQRLVHLVGRAKALEMILTGDMIDAQEAHRLGLVNHVVPDDELLPFCEKLVHKFSKKGPIAIAQSIACINAFFLEGVNGYAKESREFGNISGTEDFSEGVAAFIGKRKADFRGK